MEASFAYTKVQDAGRCPPSTLQILLTLLVLLATMSLTALVWESSALHSQPPHLSLRASDPQLLERRTAVRDAMQFVWENYHKKAFGADEMEPMRGMPLNPWGHVGCMILDSMDTLWVMGLTSEFEQARRWVHEELRFDNMGTVSVFETIIRALGGLLSAYDLSGDRVFLTKAVELAERLLPAISSETGRADYRLNMDTNVSYQPGGLAEVGTYQLEFEYLSAATGDPKYSKLAQKLYPYLQSQENIQQFGLFANEIYAFDDASRLKTRLTLTLGGGGDSFYEYLLKVWIFKGQHSDALTKQMYLDAVDGMEELLLAETFSGQLFLGEYEIESNRFTPKLQHLACFVPGWLTLGAKRLQAEDATRSARHLKIAERLMKTCYEQLYKKQPTRLSPESIGGPELDDVLNPSYLLRPEVVESLYVMNQLTGDPVYQEWGWQIFSAIQRNCKTRFGYSEYRDVTTANELDPKLPKPRWHDERVLNDKMETFFTAETLKYLYLLLDPTNKHVNLATHVFNTEAHPLTIPAT